MTLMRLLSDITHLRLQPHQPRDDAGQWRPQRLKLSFLLPFPLRRPYESISKEELEPRLESDLGPTDVAPADEQERAHDAFFGSSRCQLLRHHPVYLALLLLVPRRLRLKRHEATVRRKAESEWQDVQEDAFEAVTSSRKRCLFPKKYHSPQRNLSALSFGISYGGGRTRPGNLCHSKRNSFELSKLRKNASISRIAGHASASFAIWAPKFHSYEDHLNDLLRDDPNLFSNSVWDSKLVIEFPAGSTILQGFQKT
ncbi:hypothetical protein BDN70DRAFT_901579 [Pholiota conissans]|uniref:Uncharacterized protein n=1 Tax=Pholiota conissans TaxID=109636 RepID=A0A9P6CT26_9AGAR|nr:hypothetical protein BDN70DRAFT_901579 [Pholiota conissans]